MISHHLIYFHTAAGSLRPPVLGMPGMEISRATTAWGMWCNFNIYSDISDSGVNKNNS